MSKLIITGGRRLDGSVRVQGAKNSVLPILAASLVTGGATVIENAPRLSDVEASLDILRCLGCEAYWTRNAIYVNSSGAYRCRIPPELTGRMRSSVIFLGALIARFRSAVISRPGGCELGARPVDIHLSALRALGASVYELGGDIAASCEKLRPNVVTLPFPSVGATENAMILASAAPGVSVIRNAAREPEIRDLAKYLRAAGVPVYGAGTANITVTGGKSYYPFVVHRVMPDRIAAATYLAAVCAAGGRAELTGAEPGDMQAVLKTLEAMGARVKTGEKSVLIRADGRLKSPGVIETAPHPGFPTDAQPLFSALCLTSEGETEVRETIFENRFSFAEELCRMGGDITVSGMTARIRGVDRLRGCAVTARDLRGGAALMTAALGAEGVTGISGVGHILRGYERPDEVLRALGADALMIN